jgi:hypothetical protein
VGAAVENARIDCDELVRARATPSAGTRGFWPVVFVFVRDAGGDVPGGGRDVPARGTPADGDLSCERVPPDGERSCALVPPDGDRSCPVKVENRPVFAAVAPDESLRSVARGTPLDSVIVRGPLNSTESAGVGTRPIAGSLGVGARGILVGVGARVCAGGMFVGVGRGPGGRVGARGSVGVRPIAGSLGGRL